MIRKNIFFLLLAILFFVGAGEEISWGQRIFSFSTPESLDIINVQHEFNIHNIDIFNGYDINNNRKTGISNYLTINSIFKLFSLCFGVLLPIIVMTNKRIRHLVKRIRLPVPPLLIGSFFLIDWIVTRFIKAKFWQHDDPQVYYYVLAETSESVYAFIFFVLGIYFFKREMLHYNEKLL